MLTALISNIKTIAGNKPQTRSQKHSFFEKTWGKNTAFLRNVGRGQFESLEPEDKNHQSQINDQILVMYKTDMTANRATFVSKMASESISFLAQKRRKLEEARLADKLVTASVAAMVEHMFEILKAYSYEVNNAVGFGPLHLAATAPQMVTEVTKFNSLRQAEETVTHFRARLSTSRCSLVIRGSRNEIEFFVLPVARAMGLSKQEACFAPLGHLWCSLEDDSVSWEDDRGVPLSAHKVETICMELFAELMNQTRQQLVNDDADYHSRAC